MERFLLYSGVSIVFGAVLGALVGIWYPQLFIFVLIIGTGLMFFMFIIGCMGDYTIRLEDKDDIQTK
jgi:hypothetical protein